MSFSHCLADESCGSPWDLGELVHPSEFGVIVLGFRPDSLGVTDPLSQLRVLSGFVNSVHINIHQHSSFRKYQSISINISPIELLVGGLEHCLFLYWE